MRSAEEIDERRETRTDDEDAWNDDVEHRVDMTDYLCQILHRNAWPYNTRSLVQTETYILRITKTTLRKFCKLTALLSTHPLFVIKILQ